MPDTPRCRCGAVISPAEAAAYGGTRCESCWADWSGRSCDARQERDLRLRLRQPEYRPDKRYRRPKSELPTRN